MTHSADVWLVDDDPLIRKTLTQTLRQAGYRVESCADARTLLDAWHDDGPSCLIVDLQLPDMDGLALQRALKAQRCMSPIIFISGHGTIPATVAAVKEGAMDFLEKPFRPEDLLRRVAQAVDEDEQRRESEAEQVQVCKRLDSLTAREREVMALMTCGLSNKRMAKRLTISPRTVENHRAHVMAKMGADNLAHLCSMVVPLLKESDAPDPVAVTPTTLANRG